MNGEVRSSDVRRGLMAVWPEFMFVVLPVIVTIYAYIRTNKPGDVWHSPEWAFAAVVFAGQTSMKLLTASRRLNKTKLDTIAVLILVLVVAGVAVLNDILQDELSDRPVPEWLMYAQLILCVLSALAFLFFGTIAHIVSKDH